ncbi:unnamed protein product [Adineta ricciae]|uniref:Vesicle transport protein n=1 Tax=Adineta ricciae TaxID=249248 RepID=A0A815HXS8_ADIRI|nr:unnamed protein product [Adineta ricciae]CAF1360243.1 unnamed protein product [Adineta ricciae]
MDAKFSRLKNFADESNTSSNMTASHDNAQSWSQAIFSKDLFQTNVNRVQSFFNKRSEAALSSSSSTDDMQNLLQKGDNDPILPALSRKQRILGFMMCLTMGILCMCLATLYIPVIVLKARKFAVLFSFGSLFFLSSFSMLWGPTNHFKHLTNVERLPFSITYLVTLLGTVYYSVWVKSYFFTIIFAILQIGALVWYIVSYIPGGAHDMLIQSCLQRTISSSHLIISIRTFKRFGEYVKNYGHEPKYYQGGYLPRASHLKDPPDYLPPFIDPNEWSLEASTFGQNDYIDILGDENVEHWQLVRNAPFWLRGFQGNELQHLLRRLKLQGKYLEENQPQRYSDLITRIRYLMFKINFKHYKRPWLIRPVVGPDEPLPDYYDPRSS